MNRRQFVAAAAALPFAVRGGTAFAAAGVRDLALVTCDTEARIAVVDLATGRIVRSIPTLPGPRSVERVGEVAVVAHTALGAVSIVDAHRVRRVLRDFSEPRYAAAHPLGRHAFVTDSAHSDLYAVDVLRGAVVGRLRLEAWARHLTIDRSGRGLWVGLGNAESRIAVVDVRVPARPRLVRYLRAPFGAHDVGFDSATVWVTAGDAREVAVYDRRRGLRLRLGAGAPPQHVAFGTAVAYVTSGRDGVVRVHALDDGAVIRTTAVPVGSYNVQHGAGGRVITPSLDAGTLAVLDARGRLLRTIDVAASCHDACFIAA
ncbi:MAG TPA: hypothetical protein VK278_01870 [Gaiellaceae bacterium]|nr:hypothetical protein [Gaiellaceae bacterium]